MERPNIQLPVEFGTTSAYSRPNGGGSEEKYVPRDRAAHAARLLSQIDKAIKEAEARDASSGFSSGGFYLEFDSAEDTEFAVNSLEDKRQGIRLLNVHAEGGVTRATVFVPSEKKSFHKEKVERYSDPDRDSKKGNPSGKPLLNNIENIVAGSVRSLWTDSLDKLPSVHVPKWVEVWLHSGAKADVDVVEDFFALLDSIGIEHKGESTRFPERCVVLMRATLTDLESLVACCGSLTEMRAATTATSFFTNLSGQEQSEWADDLLARIDFGEGASVVCVLDSGVNAAHPLLSPVSAQETLLSINPDWGLSDNIKHGTSVAGIAVYGDLKSLLDSEGRVSVNHRLESVKIVEAGKENDPELYGEISMQAASRIEIQSPRENRIFCSAVTGSDSEKTDGRPTAWSAAIDELIARPGEEGAELFMVSAGNVSANDLREAGYPEANQIRSVRSPGQAWNVLTVGGYVEEDLPDCEIAASGFSPVASRGSLSPYSSTSLSWGKRTPIKPEILCPAGCMITDGKDYFSDPSLSVLSTSAEFLKAPFEPFYATSAAVSYAAWMASEIENAYPALWPETIRALMVHSAEWTDQMKSLYCGTKAEDTKNSGRRKLLRTCGYGIPSLDRALSCTASRVNLIVEDELQPFHQENSNADPKLNEMRCYCLPWPKEALQDLGISAKARLKVTLSYYVEPSPSGIGWNDKYRYPSFGLRFDVNRPEEDLDAFLRRVNANMRGEGEPSSGAGSPLWYIGSSNRDEGSIHSDFIDAGAIELSSIEYVAVYPVGGWWYTRKHLGKANSTARFSLVVSIEAPDADVDLYSEVIHEIELRSPVAIEI